jgi:predicted ThiF/HesA family dinucleotide-utilizing enzyme
MIRVSSHCTDGSCVGVGIDQDEVRVVDTKSDDGPALRFTLDEWAAFVAGVKAGEFDL